MSESAHVFPVLVADLADDAARDFLTGIALAHNKVHLPLIVAPANNATHVLEIYTPGSTEPLVLFAEPLGAPTAVGFPLKLRPYDPEAAPAGPSWRPEPPSRPGVPTAEGAAPLRPRSVREHTLSKRHTQDLDGVPVTAEPQALVGRRLANGKLRIDALIGAGGVGSVYKAFHRDLRIDVAVKVLHEAVQQDIEFCRRFHAEATAASRLDHPNLMRVLDFGQEPDGLLYLAMEYLDGKSLATELVPGRAMPLERTTELMMQVCAGLAHAHMRGIVHRDVKPDNIVLIATRDDDDNAVERVKVCDFGIAVLEADGASAVIMGTPDYMSPEQCRGDKEIDGRSDVYACGVVLYELATGQLPFQAATPIAMLNRQLHAAPVPPSQVDPTVPPEVEAVIMKALAKDPADRHASMRELRNELRALGSGPASSRSPAPPASVREPPARVPSLPPGAPPPSSRPTSEDHAPDWLERGGSYQQATTSQPPRRDSIEARSPVSTGSARALLGELTTRPAAWLASLAQTDRRDLFHALGHQLAATIPLLVESRNAKVLFAIRSTLDMLAVEEPGEHLWRSAGASSLLQLFSEPSLLMGLAEEALTTETPPREVDELLLRAGSAAAYAMYSTRLKMEAHHATRRRFVAAVQRLEASAMPMIRAGLAKLVDRRELLVATQMAADLFEAAPRMSDDVAGDVTARYLDGRSPAALTAAAVPALVGFWGERARPVLLGLLAGDDATRLSAIRGLRELRGVDEHVVLKIVAAARTSASPEVRAAARKALMEATAAARPAAERALGEILVD